MLILRLRQAECALADGRLGEAFDIAQEWRVREHRRGQKLIGRLTRAFVRRGRENLDDERIQHALCDCNQAAKLSGDVREVAELRGDICKAMERKQLGHQERSVKVAQARARIENGWLSVGEKILGKGECDDGGGGRELLEQVAAARMQMDEAVVKIEKALEHGDIDAAAELFRRGEVSHSTNSNVAQVRSKLNALAAGRIEASFDVGRIDSAIALYEAVGPVAGEDGRMNELGAALGHCRGAARCVAEGRPREAVALLRKVALTRPLAKWLKSVVSEVQRAAESLEEISAGPLGLIAAAQPTFDEEPTVASNMNDEAIPRRNAKRKAGPAAGARKNARANSPLSGRFVLQIDGVGSFLVLRDAQVTVGPMSSSARPAVGLTADPNLPVIEIERTDDDYFLRSGETVRVNDARVTEKLLADGDKIALSNRCRMKFHIPNAASTTAVLDLSGARLGRADIRRVVLMDREILIGPASNNHIYTGLTDETVTLFARNGSLFCRAKGALSVEGKSFDSHTALRGGRQIRVGGISLVLTDFEG